MEEKGISGSQVVDQGEKKDGLNSLYFGVSCAFFALGFLSRPEKEEDKLPQWCDKMLQGSSHLLGLLVWRFQREASNCDHGDLLQRLEAAEKEIKMLKQMRREDAKANEKVVGIFASQEQGWLTERKKLRQHIGALLHELRIVERSKEEAFSEYDDKLKEMEDLIRSKDKIVEEEENMRKELEEKLKKAEQTAEEMRESAKHEAQEHSTDLWKHKTAFLELVSNQRQLEAEINRALRQLEAKREELDSVLEQKEESVMLAQKLSMEVVKNRKDLEQKDKILSAMLRKSKLDTAEKQLLLKEVKLSKAKRKQDEFETENCIVASEPRHERHHSLRSMFAHQTNSRSDDLSFERGSSQIGNVKSQPADYLLEFENPEFRKDWEFCSPFSDRYSVADNEELADIKRLEGWVRSEAEKYAVVIEKRHHAELEAFVEQMRLKDEKLQAFSWRLMSMEIESKRLQSHIEGLNQDVSELRYENMKLEALLLEKQEEIDVLKGQLMAQIRPQSCPNADANSSLVHYPALVHDCIMSEPNTENPEPAEKEGEAKADMTETLNEEDADKDEEDDPPNQSKNAVQSPEKEFEEEKNVSDRGSSYEESASVYNDEKSASPSQPLTMSNNPPWRMDFYALGVSYKIKRLRQQMLVLERLTGKQENGEDHEQNDSAESEMKALNLFLSLLDKQVSRYQSLQAKTDELCKRMHYNYAEKSRREPSTSRLKGETKTLEHFLEETFQLQRYMVATGQKLMEVQSKITSGFVEVSEKLDKSVSGDMKRFADNIRTLFQEVQKGLEVRIARIIGDLEGTLACEGIIRIGR